MILVQLLILLQLDFFLLYLISHVMHIVYVC